MKVHITLVGGQPAPVYHGIVATSPDYVVFVCSSSSRQVLNKLIPELDIPYQTFNLDPTDPHEICGLAESLAHTFEKDEATVNISSGLKSWSHFFGIVFDKCPNAAVVYMDQNNVLWNYRTMTSSVGFEFDMHVLFRLYGNPLNNYRRFVDYTEDDLACLPEIESARKFCHEDFRNLTSLVDSKVQRLLKTNATGHINSKKSCSYVDWERNQATNTEKVHLCLYGRNGQHNDYTWDTPHAIDIVFNTGWFELKVASILSRWEKTREVLMNCRFPFVANIDKNEVDVIVNTETKLLFVECKTQIAQTTDIDKFRSVVKGYGGMGSKGLFITMAKMNAMARQKCRENGLLCFSLGDDHNGLPAEEALFALLNREIFNINTK